MDGSTVDSLSTFVDNRIVYKPRYVRGLIDVKKEKTFDKHASSNWLCFWITFIVHSWFLFYCVISIIIMFLKNKLVEVTYESDFNCFKFYP